MTVRVSILYVAVFRNAVQICACAKLHCCSLMWALLTMKSAKPHVTTNTVAPPHGGVATLREHIPVCGHMFPHL